MKISDFGLIHWEEGMDSKVFMEDLMAYGNISSSPPETFSKNSDPPGTSFDVYRLHTNMFVGILFFIMWINIFMTQGLVSLSLVSRTHTYTGVMEKKESTKRTLLSFEISSFGIIIWEILTQQKPYAGTTDSTCVCKTEVHPSTSWCSCCLKTCVFYGARVQRDHSPPASVTG